MNRPAALADYLAVVRRRRWIVVAVPVVAVVAAFVLSSSQRGVYRASAQVLVNRSSVVALIANISDPSVYDPTRFLATEASIARSPVLAARVVAAAGVPGLSAGRLLAESSVTPAPDADLLSVAVSDRSPRVAVALANAYANQFTQYKTELDTARINAAVRSLAARTAILRADGQAGSAAYATLIQYQGQLETVGRLLAHNTTVLQPASGAAKISPRPRRDAILAGLLGAVLGLALAFLTDSLDRRVRSEHEVEEGLGLPLLARVPRPPRRLEKANRLVMLTQPTSLETEPFRKLRTSLEFVNVDQHARTILITSAVGQEGKSTTIANLAVALARSGRKVAVVDLDLRRPFLDRLFHVGSAPGLSDVALGHTKLSEALRPIALKRDAHPTPRRRGMRSAGAVLTETLTPGSAISSNGHSAIEGVLSLLPAGTTVSDPGEFIGREGIAGILEELGGNFDFVLVDSPPLLALGDAMTLSAKVDAMFVVARLRFVRRGVLEELARQLETCQAEKLGFVLTGAELEEGYGQGDYYSYAAPKAGQTEQQPVQ
jgi:polysaccharide biosynthesis transport protein